MCIGGGIIRTMGDMIQRDAGRKETGRIGEDVACQFLERKGFKIIGRNYRKPWGEIDIIAEKSGIIRFIEVKTVSREKSAGISREMGDYRPEEQVHEEKLKKVARTAELYMDSTGDAREFQIDVVGVFLDAGTRTARCRLLEQVL